MLPKTLKLKVVLYLAIALSAAMLLFTGLVAWSSIAKFSTRCPITSSSSPK